MEIEKGATIYDLHFSKDGSMIGCNSYKYLKIWNIINDSAREFTNLITSYNFSYIPNEILIYTGANLHIFDYILNQFIYTYNASISVININVSADKKFIIGTRGRSINLLKYNNTVGIKDEHKSIKEYNIYPNPIDKILIIDFYLNIPQSISISIDDISGKTTQLLKNTLLSVGQHHYSFPLRNFTDGMYYVNIKSEKINISEKIIINR
jgi:hypothetical protein